MERPQIKRKNVSTETRQNGPATQGARLKKILIREFWYKTVCVGSYPTPVRKRYEHDEAVPSADKFCHTGTSIQDDSPKQNKTKDSQRHPWLIAEWFKNAQKRRCPAETCETRKYTRVSTKIFSNGWQKPLSRLQLWIEKFTQLKGHTSKANMST